MLNRVGEKLLAVAPPLEWLDKAKQGAGRLHPECCACKLGVLMLAQGFLCKRDKPLNSK